MGRYREPAEPKSRYITAAGAKALNDELKYLWKVKRPAITQSVKEAAAQGDRSENAEYIYGKKQLREIDRRVRYLSKRLDVLTVVDRLPEDRNTVFFGAWVTVMDEQDHEGCYRIVGPDEIGQTPGYISMDSPMAKQLLKKHLGDEFSILRPDGNEAWYEITGIEYREAKESS
ncbi:transcription elongation factor GreB [Amphritea balenae]|uniref:Transcription elongation factor GreB n=1 Tax=Amphritea balenae TaxID=452629 RepID=A0A3P1SR66_9GAMM|nr:transcription elongation factor GreB [Amphritea balenae]RRC99676.1 transcription elongation factor GreB [Amphritea balenae]GGK78907.1 transcription elongation factor GreB [Amphritea balenae]